MIHELRISKIIIFRTILTILESIFEEPKAVIKNWFERKNKRPL